MRERQRRAAAGAVIGAAAGLVLAAIAPASARPSAADAERRRAGEAMKAFDKGRSASVSARAKASGKAAPKPVLLLPKRPAGSPVLACDGPVRRGDSAESLMARFGEDARRGRIAGPEGQDARGVVLYGDSAARRIEVSFRDARMTRIAAVTVRGHGWRLGNGLRVGDDVVAVERANGRFFRLFGFEWDYGGYVSSWRGGALDHLAGGCNLGMRFGPGEGAEVPAAISGEGQVRSSQSAVREVGARVEEVSLHWPSVTGRGKTHVRKRS